MGAIPGSIDTDQSPPLTIPLRHFVVGLGILVAGALLATAAALGWLAGVDVIVYVHLLLAGWVCVTIMGAMTQFVPVWSNVPLHSRRLATAQLWLVVVGLVAFAGALLSGRAGMLPLGGALVLVGFWVFVYNVGRTLWPARPWDVTERHFAMALGFLLVVTTLGFALAVGYTRPVFAGTPVSQGSVQLAHATLAIYGVVLTTILGALYQLATMFTQSDLHGIDHRIQRVEEVAVPVGVVALAGGRLFELATVARIGALLVVVSVLGFSVLLGRRLYEAQVEWAPMLSRYAVVAAAMAVWAGWTAAYWLRDPLDPATLYGAPGAIHLLTFGVIGFVILGTLYHVVPFIVWVHHYSDLLGLAEVPMVDDLYDDRLAAADFALLAGGLAAIVAADVLALPVAVAAAGGGSISLGAVTFLANVLLVIRRHSPQPLSGILFERFARPAGGDESGAPAGPDGDRPGVGPDDDRPAPGQFGE